MVQSTFDIMNSLGETHECDGQTCWPS